MMILAWRPSRDGYVLLHRPFFVRVSFCSPFSPAVRLRIHRKKITADTISELKSQYKSERDAANKAGYTKIFSPEWSQAPINLSRKATMP